MGRVRWRVDRWRAVHRGYPCSVEEAYRDVPRWEWRAHASGYGRAETREEAQRAAIDWVRAAPRAGGGVMGEREEVEWVAALWATEYRGCACWVEQVYSADPKWEWRADDGSGRAMTREGAQRDALDWVDLCLGQAGEGA